MQIQSEKNLMKIVRLWLKNRNQCFHVGGRMGGEIWFKTGFLMRR